MHHKSYKIYQQDANKTCVMKNAREFGCQYVFIYVVTWKLLIYEL